jgi:ABC-type nitrate/sulfonate/bicarbonate transport system substrate-binding protein
MTIRKKLGSAFLVLVIVVGCSTQNTEPTQRDQHVKILLDWTPNTNHTGLYVARDKGYFSEEGLKVDIILPGSGAVDALVAKGEVEFGVSAQEAVTFARTEGLPIVSIGAIVQNNTSGFASPIEKQLTRPKHLEGKTYGGWGSPIEEATLRALMSKDGGDVKKVRQIQVGNSDFFTATQKDIDFMWIYYGWTGIEAQLRGMDMNMIWLNAYDDALDYYTPVIVTNEDRIKNDPQTVRAFMRAVSRGYDFAIQNPSAAAETLIAAHPDLNAALVRKSAQWLSTRYAARAPQWGIQKKEVWERYAQWLRDAGAMQKPFEAERAFTNAFLPTPKLEGTP